jgi:hypothetical protein
MIITVLTVFSLAQYSPVANTLLIPLLPNFEKVMAQKGFVLGKLRYSFKKTPNHSNEFGGNLEYTFHRNGNVNNAIRINSTISGQQKVSVEETRKQRQAIFKSFGIKLPGCDNVDVNYSTRGGGGLIAYMPYCETTIVIDPIYKKTATGYLAVTYKWTKAELDEQFIELANEFCNEMNAKIREIRLKGSHPECNYHRSPK